MYYFKYVTYSYVCLMHTSIRIIILMFLFNLSSESAMCQRLYFKHKYKEKAKEYDLPIKLKCFFADGTTRNLILDSISGDSMHFRKYYNQPNYDCSIYELKDLRIYHPLNSARDLFVLGWSVNGAFILAVLPLILSDDPIIALKIGLIIAPFIIIPIAVFYVLTKNKFDLKVYEVGER